MNQDVNTFQNPSINATKGISDESVKAIVESNSNIGSKLDNIDKTISDLSSGINAIENAVNQILKEVQNKRNNTVEDIQIANIPEDGVNIDNVMPEEPSLPNIEVPTEEVNPEVEIQTPEISLDIPEIPEGPIVPDVPMISEEVQEQTEEISDMIPIDSLLNTNEASAPEVQPIDTSVVNETPAVPETPAVIESVAPVVNETPVVPVTPAVPEVPVVTAPAAPVVNETPVAPVTPAVPGVPIATAPEVPEIVTQNAEQPVQNNVITLDTEVLNAMGDGKQRSIVLSEQEHNLLAQKTNDRVLTLNAA